MLTHCVCSVVLFLSKVCKLLQRSTKKSSFAGEIFLLPALHLADLQSLLHQAHDTALWRRTENKKKSEIDMEVRNVIGIH